MILAVTGHRPEKLGGYSEQAFNKLVTLAEMVLDEYKPTLVLTGMALGWDQAVAQACDNKHVAFTACVPFYGQDSKWPDTSKAIYAALCGLALKTVIVSEGGYSAAKMQIRNEYMVDHCDLLIALYDGTPGGTANCVNYAKKVGRKGFNWYPRYKQME
jgi:uncharacterized phage-like protein YoqJ